jgi:hypothetical protein
VREDRITGERRERQIERQRASMCSVSASACGVGWKMFASSSDDGAVASACTVQARIQTVR